MAALADFSTLSLSLDTLLRKHECPICFQFHDTLMKFQCNHIYCKPCGEKLVECATCRQTISGRTVEKRNLIDLIKKKVHKVLEKAIKEVSENNPSLQALMDRRNLLLRKIKQVWINCLHLRDAELSRCFQDKEEIEDFINRTNNPEELFIGIKLANKLFSCKFSKMKLMPDYQRCIKLIFENDLFSNLDKTLNTIKDIESNELDEVYKEKLSEMEEILIKFAHHWKDENYLKKGIDQYNREIQSIDKAIKILGQQNIIAPSFE